MKSHLLRLLDLLLFEGLDDLLLLEVEVPPFLPFVPLEFSPFSASKIVNGNLLNHSDISQ